MPDNLIKEYMAEARNLKEKNNLNTIFVLRGFYKNSFRETSEKIGILCENKYVSVIVDPTLFEKYNINQVPTVIKQDDGDFYKISGSVSIGYALEKFSGDK